MQQVGSPLPNPDDEGPATLPFSPKSGNRRPTTHFDLNVPPAGCDMTVGIDYFSPSEAYLACAEADQEILYAPDGSAFLFRLSPKSAASSTNVTFRA